jgi:hypothetical protein
LVWLPVLLPQGHSYVSSPRRTHRQLPTSGHGSRTGSAGTGLRWKTCGPVTALLSSVPARANTDRALFWAGLWVGIAASVILLGMQVAWDEWKPRPTGAEEAPNAGPAGGPSLTPPGPSANSPTDFRDPMTLAN